MNKIKPELLAPAGSFEKAKTAFLYGNCFKKESKIK